MAAVIAAVVAEHSRAEEQLRELATTDSLTGLANYRRLLERACARKSPGRIARVVRSPCCSST